MMKNPESFFKDWLIDLVILQNHEGLGVCSFEIIHILNEDCISYPLLDEISQLTLNGCEGGWETGRDK